MARGIGILAIFIIIFVAIIGFNYLPSYWDGNMKLLMVAIPLGLLGFVAVKS